MSNKAKVSYYDAMTDTTQIVVDSHEIQYGGSGGDGFCYSHQSFDCIDNLTPRQQRLVAQA